MPEQDANSHEGLGIGVGIAVAGAMLLLIPLLITVEGGWLVGLYAIAIVVAFIGITGVLFELATLRNRPEIQDIGVGALLFGFAGALLVIRLLTELPYLVTLLLVIVLVVLMLIAVVGTCMGIFKAVGNEAVTTPHPKIRSTKRPADRHDKLNANDYAMLGVTLFCGVLTAAVTLIAAFITAGS